MVGSWCSLPRLRQAGNVAGRLKDRKRSSRSSRPYYLVRVTKYDSLSCASLQRTATVHITQAKAFLSIHRTKISLIYKRNKTSYDTFMQIDPTENHNKVTTYNTHVHRQNKFTHHSQCPTVARWEGMTRFDQIRQLQLVTSNLQVKLINTKYPLQTRSAVYTFIALQPDTDSDMPIILSPACILGNNCPGD